MKLENAAFIGLLLLVTLAFFGLLADFAQPVFWAAALAVIFHPVYTRTLKLLRGRSPAAAFLTLIFICITVVLPAIFIASALASEATLFYERVESGEINVDGVIKWSRNNAPIVIDALDTVGVSAENIKNGMSTAAIKGSQFVGSLAISAGQNAVRFSVMFFIMLYVLFFFLRDGEKLLDYLILALPLGDERERTLLRKFAEVSRATIKGTLVIGLVQGTLGGIIFAVLGVQGAVFWGVVMVILSLLPVVGSGLVWGPVAIAMAVAGDYVSALVLAGFGMVIIGLCDNLLRPMLVGRDTRMPDYLVLLSTLGGLTVFGASGFVIGPIIAALFLTLWVMFAREFNGVEIDLDKPPAKTESD